MITNRLGFASLLLVLMSSSLFAQRQMETLGRGVVAVRTGSSTVYVGWRLLGTDPDDAKFNLYRVTSGTTNLVAAHVTNSCNVVDGGASQAQAHSWFVQPVLNGVTQANSGAFSMPALAPTQQYLNLPLQKPADGVNASGPFTYTANDCSAADLDGDGEYEIILKWDPSNSKDNSQSGFTGDVFLDAYKLDGTLLWRINLGPNIRAGAHYTQFMVYDLDGDGRAELACKTAPGTRDGLGNYVDGNASYTVYTNSSGYILSGPEYFTIFDGLTGANLATTNYIVPRGNVGNWGDTYGNRVDRFLAAVAYLDGVRPSVVMCRGYYTRATLCAWDWRNGQLKQRWLFDTDVNGLTNYRGQGAHSLSVGDVDGDGKDEIVFGACTIDDNGAGLYSTGLGHGDAEHYSDMDPFRDGQEIWFIHESPSSYGAHGLEMHDAGTGEIIFSLDGQNSDVGRGVAIDVDPRYPGYEMWGSRPSSPSVWMNATGVPVPTARPGSMNFACWWDADLLREILDGTTISKWNWLSGSSSSILSPGGLLSNNSTKSTPCLSADLFGDWREEVVWRTSDNLNLRIYTTTNVTTNRLYTLMHDPQYRCAIAWQNVAYNQPPHPGFNIGPDMYAAPRAPISTAQLAWRGGNGGNSWTSANNWFANGVWTNDVVTSYAGGNSVLFDLRASNNTAITISGIVSPGDVTVYSPGNFTFSGSGSLSGAAKLFKSGPGRLTVNTTNDFTGGTFVGGGQLIVNGTLNGSPVVVESRGEPWGRARIGGSGKLGQGLTVQKDCGVIVGPGTNATGTLTITNGLSEQGGVLNQFDLSNASGGGNNDRIDVIGNLTLTGTNVIHINQLNGSLGAGVYPLITYSGTLSGGLVNLALTGDFVQQVALTNPPNMIALVAAIPPSPPNAPSGLTATPIGAFQINLGWSDNATNEIGFQLERAVGSPTGFALVASLPANTTTHQDLGLASGTTYYYRVAGTNLAGATYSNTNSATTAVQAPLLAWRGDGSANEWDLTTTPNWFNGSTMVVYDDTTDMQFDDAGTNNTPVSLVGALQPGSVNVNASKNYTFSGAGNLAGTMALTKSGSGNLTLGNAAGNSFTGGVVINAGTLTLGAANTIGAGPVTLRSNATLVLGTLSLSSANPLTISNTPSLTGGNGGGLTDLHAVNGNGVVAVTVTTGVLDLQGDLSSFNGTFAFNGGNSVRFYGSTGSGNTTFDLGGGTLNLNKRSGTVGMTLGALAGGPNTTLQGASGSGNTTATTFTIGGKNISTAFQGTIINGQGTTSITKVGAGTLTLSGTNTYTGATTVSAGTLVVNGDQTAATGAVAVSPGATLGGGGIIGGPATVSGLLAPGNSIGRLTLSSNLTLSASSVVRIEVTKVPLTNDSLVVAGSVSLNGTLEVVSLGIEALEAGDHFTLLSAGTRSGVFAQFVFPSLDEGLAWRTNRFSQDGRLWVVSVEPPAVTAVGSSGGNFTFSGNGGTPGWDYHVLSSTNLLLPTAQWTPILTNQFDGVGQFNVSTPIQPGRPEQFYKLSVP